MAAKPFQPGFRLSKLDIVFLFIGGWVALDTMAVLPWIGVAIAFVILHFFYFCNIVRMSRPLELVWTAVFIAMAVGEHFALWSWPVALGITLLLTIVLTVIEIRRPSYHGVGWQWLNPGLPEWWKQHAPLTRGG